ncbi:MAG: topoisomerase IV [Clostridiales bacterium]|nr:topoisomerase IV [Candidatus Coliplasma equi]
MAKRKTKIDEEIVASEPIDVRITEVLETNYMPYAISVIVSRAIPDIDGFKPAHRKLLYTMYKMGLMTGPKQKCAKVSGATMALNPHGDAAIYETLVRLTTGKESLLHPFIESKGAFGKHYSDMAYAASRYTECKLDKFCETIFDGIDKDAVDFVPNYDNTTTEPVVLPTAFPNVIVNPNAGIAVGMASNICSFNLREVCDVTCAYLRNENITTDEVMEILKAPDFSTGGLLVYDKDNIREVYETGRGSIKLRSKYTYDKAENCIEVTEIPYTTTLEKIRETIIQLVKDGKIKEITDVRDEIDINGFKMAIDLKRGTDPEKIMQKLFRMTELEDDFKCNFNILVGSVPMVMGIKSILEEWCAFRIESLRRTYIFDLGKKSDKLHLLYGLRSILLDIDKAIAIIRHTENEKDVVPNLMTGFSIDEVQAEYVAEIKLRNLNKQYILKRLEEISSLESEIEELKQLISSERRIKTKIIKQLGEIAEKFGKPRKTYILDKVDIPVYEEEDDVPDYQCVAFLSMDGYFKKCTLASLRGSDVQKFKENDSLRVKFDTNNKDDVIFFTSDAQVYKSRLDDFDDSKASALGDYVPAKLKFEEDEKCISALCLKNYEGKVLIFFENGKAVSLPLSVYETKTNRKKLTAAFFGGSPAVAVFKASGNAKLEYLVRSDDDRALLIKESQICEKTTRTSSGSTLFNLKKGKKIVSVTVYDPELKKLLKESRYRKSNLPAAGVVFEDSDPEITQQTLLD